MRSDDALKESSNANPSIVHDRVDHQKLFHPAIERNLERNRQHAKRTRLRKKEMMEVMKARIAELQREVILESMLI